MIKLAIGMGIIAVVAVLVLAHGYWSDHKRWKRNRVHTLNDEQE